MRRALFVAAFALCLLHPAPADSSSFLQRKMKDWLNDLNKSDKAAKRSAAAFALGRMGTDAESAIPDLAEKAAKDPDAGVRDAAAAALGEIILALDGAGKAASYWKDVWPRLKQALGDGDPRVRRSAAYACGAFGKAAAACCTDLLDSLAKDDSDGVRQNAAWALGRLGVTDRATFGGLSEALRHPSAQVRRDAAGALHTLGREAEDDRALVTATRLLEMVKTEKDDAARKTALNAAMTRLVVLKPTPYKDDRNKSDDEKAEIRKQNEKIWTENEKKDKEKAKLNESAGQAVLALAKSKDEDAARVAAQVLGLLDAAKELGETLNESTSNEVRALCCVRLSHLRGEKGKPGVPALAKALKPGSDTSRAAEEVREFAAEALAQIAYPANKDAIPEIRKTIVDDKNDHARHRCIWALFNVDNLSEYDLVKPLTDVLSEKGEDKRLLRYDAARALARAEREKAPDKAVEILLVMIVDPKLQVFRDSDTEVKGGDEKEKGKTEKKQNVGGDARYMAAQALALMGNKVSDNPKVIEALKNAAKDPEPTLQAEAKRALDDLGVKD